ncbi:PREDICTED: gamma-aminobutyric acid receptor subunit beta-3-like isoform X1 [Branchiostoma belcheri]|uniref:Gamma-aminobutyric acid receptor subunit beta-3-like isoform X1 n=1 Tax=Branchiostoma belcheri TaxID=7741 RepID=A0A6P4ZPF5_BRABE|nr:PREDICTED: gamma-aminobutyric acid receptor subunit beta-3-like isoform X1 [Branchiostoma belcheri]
MPDPLYDSIRVEHVGKVFVTAGGRVLDGKRYTIESTCLMTFYNYPHDKQVCNVPIYFAGGEIARWQLPPVWMKTDSEISMSLQHVRSMFHINHVEYLSYIGSNANPEETCIYQKRLCDYAGSESCYLTDLKCTEAENRNNSLCIKCNNFGGKCSSGNTANCSSVIEKVDPVVLYFSVLEIRFKLTRRLGYHFLQTYIPSVSVVGMSWVSFWIDPASAPARTGLGVTTVLTMVTLSGKVKPAPDLNYIRAIDVWLLGCKLFVILALLEYACVNFTVSSQKVSFFVKSTVFTVSNIQQTYLCIHQSVNSKDTPRHLNHRFFVISERRDACQCPQTTKHDGEKIGSDALPTGRAWERDYLERQAR